MFTALILICDLNVMMKGPETCHAAHSANFFKTKEECVLDIFTNFEAGNFRVMTPEGKPRDLADFTCVTWDAQNI